MTAGWTYAPMLAKTSTLQEHVAGKKSTRVLDRTKAGQVIGANVVQEGQASDITALLERYFGEHDFELKMDGVRAMLEWDGSTVAVYNRKGVNFADRVPELVQRVLDANVKPFILDGEVVLSSSLSEDPDTRTGFSQVNGRINRRITNHVVRAQDPATFVAFDCLRYHTADYVNGTPAPHQERSAMARVLSEVLSTPGVPGGVVPVRRSVNPLLWSAVVMEGQEGIIIKRRTGMYLPGSRGDEWLKLKTETRLTCWAIAYDESDKVGRTLGAIHVAVMDNQADQPFYVGRVGSGISDAEQHVLRDAIDAGQFPLVEVRCNGRSDDRLRFPVYLGRRTDADTISTRHDFDLITKAV